MTRMRIAGFTTIILILTYSITSALVTSPPLSQHAQSQSSSPSSTMSINQTVTGTLTYYAQQASYGIHLDPGQYNVTLNVSSGANLGFQVSRWLFGIPTFLTVIFVGPPGVGRNSSSLLLLPTGGFNTPGDYVIRVYPASAGTLGSYWLRVQQIASFQPLSPNQQQNFTRWRSPTALLYDAVIPQFATYNFTLTTNSTATINVNTYEDEIYLPFSSTSGSNGRISFLAPLRSGDFYIVATSSAASNVVLRGSLSVNMTTTPTLASGNTVQGTVPLGQQVFYYADMTPGFYYNIVLQVPSGQNLDLAVYSPTSGNLPVAQSQRASGLNENITNLVVFHGRTYAVNAGGEYQTTAFQAQTDRVLIGVRNVTASAPPYIRFNLTLTSQPFPELGAGMQAQIYLNSTNGPYYKFYSSQQNSPLVYNITYQHKVWGTGIWSSTLALVASERALKLATTPSTTIGPFENQHIFFTQQSLGYAAEHWIGEGISNSTTDTNLLSSSYTLGIPVFADIDTEPIFMGTVLRAISGHFAYDGTLSYSDIGATDVSVGNLQSDYLANNGVNLYRSTLQAGHTYKINLQYTNIAILSLLYSSTGYMQPTTPPLFSLILISDLSLPENGYYYLFTPSVTADYYLTASGSFFFATTGGGSYSLTIQELSPPTLSLTINSPISQKLGQPFNVTATVTDNGDYEAENVALSLSLPLGITKINNPNTSLDTLAAGASTQVTWTLNSTIPGNQTLNIQASSSNTPSVTASASPLITAPSLQVTIAAPSSASPGTSFPVQISVKNSGNAAAGPTTLTLVLPAGLSTSPSTQTLASIDPGQTLTLTWNVNADNPGDYKITALANEQYAGSTTITASISVPPPWQYYLFAGILGALVIAFILGVLFESRRESRRSGTLLPPPPAASK